MYYGTDAVSNYEIENVLKSLCFVVQNVSVKDILVGTFF